MGGQQNLSSPEELLRQLEAASIKVERAQHAPVATIQAMVETLPKEFMEKGSLVKNLFLYDKKKNYYVISALSETEMNLKVLATLLSAPGLRMAHNDVLFNMLGVKGGSVTPLAVVNDSSKSVTFVFDQAIKSKPFVLVHPLHNEETLLISSDDLIGFVESQDHTIKWVNCKDTAAPSPAVKTNDTPQQKTKDSQQKVKPVKSGTDNDANAMGILNKKSDNFAEWYTECLIKAEMLQYYDISGCYIIRPWGYHIWESIVQFIDTRIKSYGVQNASFPMFVTRRRLETEKEHVEGFSPEVAWVTKYGDSDLAEPIAIRPTSETIMYPAYAKWIRSHRDLPLLLNQWCSVVRWEFKQPTPFIRHREFNWQEGHTAHASDKEADDFTHKILDLYASVYEDLLAVPVIKGIKSDGEKFGGAKKTTTVEAFVASTGRSIQAATSHHLGTNFAKMFNISFEDKDRKKQFVHQTSWGLTIRSLGALSMVHGDDCGVVLPPRVVCKQVVIIPIFFKDSDSKELIEVCDKLADKLKGVGVRVEVDDRDCYTPGWKYNYWELKGVPIRMEIGPRDMKNATARLVRRDNKEKIDVVWNELETKIPEILDSIHNDLLNKAREIRDNSIVKITEWCEVIPALNQKKMVLAPWCCEEETEEIIKAQTTLSAETTASDASTSLSGAMKALCIPLDQPDLPEDTKCFVSGKPAVKWCLFGRSY